MSSLLDAPPPPAPARPTDATPPSASTRALEEPETAIGQIERPHWRFVAWFTGTLLCLLIAVAGFNAWVDSTGTLGTGLVDPLAELPRDRKAKAELVERAGSPTMVVLGSSRSKRLDPRWLDPQVTTAVNAAAVASDMFEQRVMTTWLAQRATAGRPFPHIVMGVDVEQWRHSSLHESGLLAVPQLAAIAKRESRHDSLLSIAPRLGDLLFTWSATRSSVDALRSRDAELVAAKHASQDEDSSTLTRDVDEFNEWGILETDTHWKTTEGRKYLQRVLPSKIQETLDEYRDRYRGSRAKIGSDAAYDFAELIRIANENGDTPSIFLTPMNPTLAKALIREGRPARRLAVLDVLRDYAARGKIHFLDCSTRCISGNPDNWTDGVHLSPHGAHQLALIVRKRLLTASAE
jgi:hypothetical protein